MAAPGTGDTWAASRCRLCAGETTPTSSVDIFQDRDLHTHIHHYLPLKVAKNDELPQRACQCCVTTILSWHRLLQQCVTAERELNRQLEVMREEQQAQARQIAQQQEEPAPSKCRSIYEDNFHFSDTTENPSLQMTFSDSENTVVLKSKSIKLVSCSICSKQITARSYPRHFRSHSGDRPYVCGCCSKGFKNAGALSRHKREVHDKILRFNCDICGRSFACKRTMEQHRNIHGDEKKYVCDKCGKNFKLQSSLNIHLRLHSEDNLIGCDQCDKKFRRKHSLLVHERTHRNLI